METDTLEVLVRERGGVRVSCPRCGRRCTVCDHLTPRRYWCMALRMLEVVIDLRDFIDGQIFNVLIGNADAYGKNYFLLYQGGQRRLAPLYDLVCTLAWPEPSKTPAMKIGGALPSTCSPRRFGRRWRRTRAWAGP